MNKIFTLYTLLTLIILPTLQAQVVRYSHLQQGGAGNEKGTHMSILPSGVVLRAGTFEGSLNGYNSLGASDAMFNIEPNNGSSNINLGFGSSGVDEGLELFISGNKFLYCGSFKGVLDANQSSLSIYNLTSNSNPGVFLTSYFSGAVPLFSWAREIIPNNVNSYVYLKDAYVDKDGATYIIGNMIGSVFFQNSATVSSGVTLTSAAIMDIFVVKYNADGSLAWVKQIKEATASLKTGCSCYREISGNTIQVDSLKNIYIGGKVNNWDIDLDWNAGVVNAGSGGGSGQGWFVAKYDSNTNYVSHFKPNGTMTDIDEVMDIAVKGSTLVVTGVYGGQSNFSNSSSYLLSSGGFEGNGFIARYDTAFNLQWAKVFDNQSTTTNYLGREVYGNTLAVDSSNNVYVGVAYKRDVEFNPGGTSMIKTVAGNYDASVVKLNSSGTIEWILPFAGIDADVVNGIAIDPAKRLHVQGAFSSSLNIDPMGGGLTLNSNGGSDWFYAVYSQPTALPMKWVSQSVHDQTNYVSILWETNSEMNCKEYVVESSNNTEDWTVVCAPIPAKNKIENLYVVHDDHSFEGTHYYRIKQVDMDGKKEYGEVMSVIRNRKDSNFVYPNPVQDELYLHTHDDGVVNIEITNVYGVVVASQTWNTNQPIQLTALTPGQYLLKYQSTTQTFITHFTKQ